MRKTDQDGCRTQLCRFGGDQAGLQPDDAQDSQIAAEASRKLLAEGALSVQYKSSSLPSKNFQGYQACNTIASARFLMQVTFVLSINPRVLGMLAN